MAKDKSSAKDKAYWKLVFKTIEEGGYTMSGLDRDQIEKIIEMMRTLTSYYNPNFQDHLLVETMLRQVSPRTALVLYTLAWFKNSPVSNTATKREELINTAMKRTFATITPSFVLSKVWYHQTSFQMWYEDDTIGNCLAHQP